MDVTTSLVNVGINFVIYAVGPGNMGIFVSLRTWKIVDATGDRIGKTISCS